MQNAGLGAVLATRFFPDQPEAALFRARYTFGRMFTDVILAQAFRSAVPAVGGKSRTEVRARLERADKAIDTSITTSESQRQNRSDGPKPDERFAVAKRRFALPREA